MSKNPETASHGEGHVSQIGEPGATGMSANRAGRRSAYLWGAASGVVLALAAPILRPAVRSAVKGGIVLGRYAKQKASEVKEEFEDIAAEAQAELDKENSNHGTGEKES